MRGQPATILVLALVGTFGCDAFNDIGPPICRRPIDEEPIDYNGGSVVDGVYMTSPWTGPFLQFPGGEFYRLNHGLGTEPVVWELYLAFSEDPGSIAQAAGNQAVIKEVTPEYITVLNESCVDYYLLAVVWSPADDAD